MSVYYGAKAVPLGKRRATLKEALDANQIRYYGAVAVPEKKLNRPPEKRKKNLVAEELKLRRYQQDINVLLKEAQMINITRKDPTAPASKRKAAQKRMDELKKRKQTALKRIAKQRSVVEKLK